MTYIDRLSIHRVKLGLLEFPEPERDFEPKRTLLS